MWLAIAIVMVVLPIGLLGISLCVVRTLVNPRAEGGAGASATAVVCIALVLLFALLVPLDVFVADQAPDAGSAILMLYHFVFGSLLGLVFFALPFCYFFTQPHDAETDPVADVYGPRSSELRMDKYFRSSLVACRKTAGCLCLLMSLVVFAFILYALLGSTTKTEHQAAFAAWSRASSAAPGILI